MHARFGLLLGALLLVSLFASSSCTTAQEKKDAPTAVVFGGSPGRNLANTVDKNIPAKFSIDADNPVGLKWKAALGNQSFGGPLVAEGKVFVGTNNEKPRDKAKKGDLGVIMCFEEATGKFLWQITHTKAEKEVDESKCGIASTPAVENGKLYYVSNRCELVCAETANGKQVWSLDMAKDLKVYAGGLAGGLPNSSPLVIDDLVIVGTSNGVDAGTGKPKEPNAPSLVAVNKATGKVAWQNASPGNDILDGQWSSPAAAKIDGKWQVVMAFGDGWVRSFDAKTSEMLWKFDCNPKGLKFDQSARDSKNYIVAVPVIHEGKVYIGTGMEPDSGNGIGYLWCIDAAKKPANKELDLSPVGNNFDPKAAANKDSGLVWVVGGAINPAPAGNARQFHYCRSVGTVAIHDGIVYAVEMTGFLNAFDAATGKKLWEFDLKDATWSSPYYVDGKVFLGNDSGDLFVFEAGKVAKLLGKIDMNQSLKVPVTVANGTLYVTNGLYLFAIK